MVIPAFLLPSLPSVIPSPVASACPHSHGANPCCSTFCPFLSKCAGPRSNQESRPNVTETSATRCFWLVIWGTGRSMLPRGLERLGRRSSRVTEGQRSVVTYITARGAWRHHCAGWGTAECGTVLARRGDWGTAAKPEGGGAGEGLESRGAQQQPRDGCWGQGAAAARGRAVLGKGDAADLLLRVRKHGDLYVQGWEDDHIYALARKSPKTSGSLISCSSKKKFLTICITLYG